MPAVRSQMIANNERAVCLLKRCLIIKGQRKRAAEEVSSVCLECQGSNKRLVRRRKRSIDGLLRVQEASFSTV